MPPNADCAWTRKLVFRHIFGDGGTTTPAAPPVRTAPAAPPKPAADPAREFASAETAKNVAGQLAAGNALLAQHPNAPETVALKPKVVALQEAARAKAEKARVAAGANAERARLARLWGYAHETDPMTSKTSHSASTDSSNTVEFSFPYQGAQRGTLTLRRHARHGGDVIFNIARGQLQCDVHHCPISVRFDEGSVRCLNAGKPSDHDSTVTFIPNYDDFASRMLKAKKVRIEAT